VFAIVCIRVYTSLYCCLDSLEMAISGLKYVRVLI